MDHPITSAPTHLATRTLLKAFSKFKVPALKCEKPCDGQCLRVKYFPPTAFHPPHPHRGSIGVQAMSVSVAVLGQAAAHDDATGVQRPVAQQHRQPDPRARQFSSHRFQHQAADLPQLFQTVGLAQGRHVQEQAGRAVQV